MGFWQRIYEQEARCRVSGKPPESNAEANLIQRRGQGRHAHNRRPTGYAPLMETGRFLPHAPCLRPAHPRHGRRQRRHIHCAFAPGNTESTACHIDSSQLEKGARVGSFAAKTAACYGWRCGTERGIRGGACYSSSAVPRTRDWVTAG